MISDFAKEKVFWTRKMNLKLVKFIESRPNIWNPKHPKYTSISARDRTYAEFAFKYGNEFTWQAVKDRWTNIRSTFANYLRKINASQAKGDSEVYKVNWHLWKACSFLVKVNRKHNKADTKLDNDYQKEEDINLEEVVSDDEISHNDLKNSNTSCDSLASSILNIFRGVQNDAFGLENTNHGDIGCAVVKKLSQVNSYEAAQLTHKITAILLLYDENNPINPNNIKNESV